MIWTRRFRSLVAAGVLATSGCAFLSVKAPPSPPIDPSARVDCTPRSAAPIADAVLGVGFAALSIPFLNPDPPQCEPGAICLDFRAESRVFGSVLLGTGLVLLASAATGSSRTASCRELLGRVEACRAGDAVACQRVGIPGPVTAPAAQPASP